MYREGPAPLAHQLEARLGPLGFMTVPPSEELRALGVEVCFRRKTWNTNRGVVLATAPSARVGGDLRGYAERLRADVGRFLGSSFWNQLGLQLVLVTEAPSRDALAGIVDRINTQGVLIQSVFAVDLVTKEHAAEATWGQAFTKRFQDAIGAALAAFAGGEKAP